MASFTPALLRTGSGLKAALCLVFLSLTVTIYFLGWPRLMSLDFAQARSRVFSLSFWQSLFPYLPLVSLYLPTVLSFDVRALLMYKRDITSDDRVLFQTLYSFIAKSDQLMGSRHCELSSQPTCKGRRFYIEEDTGGILETAQRVFAVPAEGPTYSVRTDRGRLFVQRSSKVGTEILTIWAWRLNTLNSLHELSDVDSRGKTRVYVWTKGAWQLSTVKSAMSPDLVSFPMNMVEGVQSAITDFLDGRESYRKEGRDYKLTFLFVGAPGTGKAVLAQTLAAHFSLRLHVIDATKLSNKGTSFSDQLSSAPSRSIVLVDELDKAPRRVLNTLLTELQGAGGFEDKVLILAVNDMKEFDETLIRPGRVDRTVVFPLMTRETGADLFKIVTVDPDHRGLAERFGDIAQGCSPAAVQRYLLTKRGKPQAAVDDAADSLKPPKSGESTIKQRDSCPGGGGIKEMKGSRPLLYEL
ncbi:hypothetical protein NKR23_g9027 [Pleurostoma richardsiae]|uniref:AAA+ ATPase domain-containing protein n=1 Tax=Pleurostoma richardsiae TaxID=41990 RepID=A0AA38R7T3_9PEZI|nr:hypothetical protein NKR23_g9027 [Pleurostoma richardsiae]